MKYKLFLAGILAIAFCSCGDRSMKGEGATSIITPSVSPFNVVQVQIPLKMTITIKNGAKPSVKFRGYTNLLNHIKTKVENNILFIVSDLDVRASMDSKDVVADITMPELTEMYLSFSADAEIHGNIKEQKFKADVSGNSTVTIDTINTDMFFYTAAGSNKLEVNNGTTRIAAFSADGDMSIKAFPLQISEANVSIKGQGKCEVTALETLNTNIGSSCTLKYKGHPKVTKNPEGGTVDEAN